MAPSISVVVPTRNRPVCVMDAVRDVVEQLPPDGEVVVVEQSDPEVQSRVVRALTALGDRRVRVIEATPIGLPRARNLGLDATRGPLVLFLDDDVRLHPGCVAAHVAAYEEATVGGVVGRIVERTVRPNARHTCNRLDVFGRVRTRLDGPERVRVQTLKGANMSFRRAALEAAGPADPAFRGTAFLEDADWSTRVRRLGWALWYVPEASLDHLSAPSGGCRVEDAQRVTWWRFRNTGYFIGKHRPMTTVASLAGFSVLALKRTWSWREPRAGARLMRAWVEGWREAQQQRRG